MCHPNLSFPNIEIFLMVKIGLFCTQKKKKKSSQQHGQGNVLENFPKELPHFEEKTILIRQDFWRIWAHL